MIETADQQMAYCRVKTQEDYKLLQANQIRKYNEIGQRVTIHYVADPLIARIDYGRWIALCPCGSGVALHYDWTEAYCLGCGAIYTYVVFPPNREEIELEILKRTSPRNQFFFPDRGETLANVISDNFLHGLIDEGSVQ